MRSSASQTLLPAPQRRCTETVAAMARRKRRLAPQRNHTDSVITFYNRDTEKARDKMGNKTKKFRQISTNVHRTGCRRKKQENTLCRAWARKGGPPPFKARDGATVLLRVDAKKQGRSQRNRPAAREQPKTALQDFAVSCEAAPCHEKAPLLSRFALGVLRYKKGKNKCKFPFSPDLSKKM